MRNKVTSLLTSLSSFLLLSPTPVLAQDRPPQIIVDENRILESFSITSIGEFIGALLSLLFIISGILVFIYIVWGGLEWLTSGGDDSKTERARGRIIAAFTGIAIIALSYAIIVLVEYFFGITIIGDDFVIPRPWDL